MLCPLRVEICSGMLVSEKVSEKGPILKFCRYIYEILVIPVKYLQAIHNEYTSVQNSLLKIFIHADKVY